MEINNFAFICEKCNYKTNIKGNYEAHLLTELHLNGKRKERSDKIYPIKCDKCDVIFKGKMEEQLHYLNNHSNLKERKEKFNYYCNYCDYGTFYLDQFNKHNNTSKHKKNELIYNYNKTLDV